MPLPAPKTERIILHLDYDCFYASVIENQYPELKGKPLGVQQKQIIVTCNYEARRRGLRKLQLISEAKKTCPEVIIVLGEDLTQFRDVSKELYNLVRINYSWNGQVERLGLDEVFIDATDIVDYNLELLNETNLQSSFFHLSKTDPTHGFSYDASTLSGESFPAKPASSTSYSQLADSNDKRLMLRLQLGSHLVQHIRQHLEQNGYTCTAGISTSKLLSKLAGNIHKPRDQTTLLPPYVAHDGSLSSVTQFMDPHEIGKVPGIGFKMAHKLREHVRQKNFDVIDWTIEASDQVLVRELRSMPGVNEATLERLLTGPGAPKGVGGLVWRLIHGVDESEVSQARVVPTQISIEDSYRQLNTLERAIEEMVKLSSSLIQRMRTDLLETMEEESGTAETTTSVSWLAKPKTLRLSTRPRAVIDGSRPKSFGRISRSTGVPNFIFDASESIDDLADRLVGENILPMFRELHPQKKGWDLSLINVAVANMQLGAGEGKAAAGRDISKMFKNQDAVLSAFRIDETLEAQEFPEDNNELPNIPSLPHDGSEDAIPLSQSSEVFDDWNSDGDGSESESMERCLDCGSLMPAWVMDSHRRYHQEDGKSSQ
ncbi:DNA/RNA polymerase [Microthyrium microscopicum]|uniref:DNA/RNA polymerase n=1 Tax=Microthyrium microscopicum TaxID=703497 RepID=A0A6A6U5A6_9PEZI|nr:DNA/RNA polymerase [Microthyrium microscopicum]